MRPQRTRATGPILDSTLMPVEVRIGITNVGREIGFESSQTSAEIEQVLADAIASNAAFVTLADEKGKRFLVPTSGIAYVELGAEESRRIGFVA